ncbi:MAG: CrtD protein, partial [Pseudomonadota bacterium]
MRQIGVDGSLIDSGPTVFTMMWVFDELFAASGQNLDTALDLHKAKRLARHAWDAPNSLARPLDLFANREESRDEIGELFGFACAEGYTRFCRDAGGIHDTLRDTFMAAQLPGPVELARRVGFHRIGELLALRPFSTLWKALDGYFPDQRLQQLFGRYSTYVGSSPYCS